MIPPISAININWLLNNSLLAVKTLPAVVITIYFEQYLLKQRRETMTTIWWKQPANREDFLFYTTLDTSTFLNWLLNNSLLAVKTLPAVVITIYFEQYLLKQRRETMTTIWWKQPANREDFLFYTTLDTSTFLSMSVTLFLDPPLNFFKSEGISGKIGEMAYFMQNNEWRHETNFNPHSFLTFSIWYLKAACRAKHY